MKARIRGLAALLLALLLLGGCGQRGEAPRGAALPQVIIGSDTYPPYVYLDNNGDPIGIDVEIAQEAFRRLGYEPVFTTIDWEQKKTLLEEGKIDCIWGCFSMEGRLEDYRWAGPYLLSRQVVAVNARSSFYTLGDLAGKTVAVQSTGKPEELFLRGDDPRIPVFGDIMSLEDRGVQYAALDCGYVDAVAAHEAAILQYVEDFDADFRILEEPLLTTGIGVAFCKEGDGTLARQLEEVFAAMRQDGTMEKLVGRYLSDPQQYLEVEQLGY